MPEILESFECPNGSCRLERGEPDKLVVFYKPNGISGTGFYKWTFINNEGKARAKYKECRATFEE